MPTGYTAAILDREITFPEFAMQCARAFGALAEMRDDPMDAPIPDSFEPHSWHSKELERARTDVERLSVMNLSEIRVIAENWRAGQINYMRDSIAKSQANLNRLNEMLAQVVKWHPPTPDHQGLKDFMLEQIHATIKYDGKPYFSEADIEKIQRKSDHEIYTEKLENAKRDIEYHTKEHAEEVSRAAERTAWVRALRDSLQPKADEAHNA